MKPRIAMIGLRGIPASDGGVEVAITELAPRLVELGADVTVYARKTYQESERLDSYRGVKLVTLPTIHTKHLEAIVHSFLSTIHAITQNYNVVHYHALGNALFAAFPRLFGASTVVTMHGLDWQREKWGTFAKIVLRWGELLAVYLPNKTISVSRKIKNHVGSRYNKEIDYIPNGIPTTNSGESLQSDVLDKYALDDYVLFLGRLVPEKGIHVLIEAFSKLETDYKLVVAGRSTHTSPYVDKLLDSSSADPRIVFTGGLYGQDKEEILRNAKAFVLPSTIEGMPIALLEAMSRDIPCIVSDIEENLEVVDHDGVKHAYVFITNDAADLRQKIKDILAQPEEAEQMAKRAGQYVRANFDWSRIARQTYELYLEIL